MSYSYDLGTSSPDPLSASILASPPKKILRRRSARTSAPLQSSPSKQTFELDVGDRSSPQKIKVTVEAGSSRKSIMLGRDSTSARSGRTNTRTTTIPLKGLYDSDEETSQELPSSPIRNRGRPRKSNGTPLPAARSARLSASKGSQRPSVVEKDDSWDLDFEINENVEVHRRGRSRPRSFIGGVQDSTPAFEDTTPTSKGTSIAKSTQESAKSDTQSPGLSISAPSMNDVNDDFQFIRSGSSEAGSPHTFSGELEGTASVAQSDRGSESRFSTIRTESSGFNTLRSQSAEDVLLARFSPGMETPKRTGWSSPRNIASSSAARHSAIMGEALSKDSNELEDDSQSRVDQVQVEQEDDSMDLDNEPYQPQGDDTIIENDAFKFSMISVDSIPSLKHISPHLLGQLAGKTPTTDISTKANDMFDDDTFSSIPAETFAAATPRAPRINPAIEALRSNQKANFKDSFSSIPPELLEAATPGRALKNPAMLKIQQSVDDDTFSSIPMSVYEAATPAPAKKLMPPMSSENTQSNLSATRATMSPIPFYPTVASEPMTQSRPASRMLTPAETPSPPPEQQSAQSSGQNSEQYSKAQLEQSSEQNTELKLAAVDVNSVSATEEYPQSSAKSERITNFGSSVAVSHMQSSPPSVAPKRYTYTAHLRQRRSLNVGSATPSIVFSSPRLPPLQPPVVARTSLASIQEPTPRPSLEPIARTGRILQDVVSPLPPPRSSSQGLGSPFKSPISARKSSSFTHQEPKLPEEELRSRPGSVFGSSQKSAKTTGSESRESSVGRHSIRSSFSDSVHEEDPFLAESERAINRDGRSPVGEASASYKLDLPSSRLASTALYSTSMMSWQEERRTPVKISLNDSIARQTDNVGQHTEAVTTESSENSISGTLEAQWAKGRATVSEQIQNSEDEDVIVISSDDGSGSTMSLSESSGSLEANGDQYDYEEDLFLAEARESSSTTGTPEKPEVAAGIVEKVSEPGLGQVHEKYEEVPRPLEDILNFESRDAPRRSKLPSPWRQNSRRLIYSDELQQSSPAVEARVSTNKSKHIVPPKLASAHDAFSVQAGDETTTFSLVVTSPAPAVIPQKQNFAPQVRQKEGNIPAPLDLHALLASSPSKPRMQLPTLQTNVGSTGRLSYSSVESENSQHDESSTKDMGSSIKETSSPQSVPFTNLASEKKSMIDQNMVHEQSQQLPSPSISPIHREAPLSFRSSEQSRRSSPLATEPPILSSVDVPSSNEASSPAEITSKSNSSTRAPLGASSPSKTNSLNLNSSLNESQTKSSLFKASDRKLRGTPELFKPIKPIVNRAEISSQVQDENLINTVRRLDLQKGVPRFEPQTSKASTISETETFETAPQPTSKAHPVAKEAALSGTEWSKEHWKLLKRLWKSVDQTSPSSTSLSRLAAHPLIGHVLTSPSSGASLELTTTHLYVVNKFQRRVPGCSWNEEIVAGRLFAIVVGDQWRREKYQKEKYGESTREVEEKMAGVKRAYAADRERVAGEDTAASEQNQSRSGWLSSVGWR